MTTKIVVEMEQQPVSSSPPPLFNKILAWLQSAQIVHHVEQGFETGIPVEIWIGVDTAQAMEGVSSSTGIVYWTDTGAVLYDDFESGEAVEIRSFRDFTTKVPNSTGGEVI